MLSLTDSMIRASFVNASRKELSELTLPPELGDAPSGAPAALDWDRPDYLGWRDRKQPRRAYLVIPHGDELVGIVLRQAEAAPRSRAQCTWCQDVQLPNDVVFFSAKRAGNAGRNGNTLGTLLCSEFECSANVRRPPVSAYLGFDVEAARQERMAGLRVRAAGFAEAVLNGG